MNRRDQVTWQARWSSHLTGLMIKSRDRLDPLSSLVTVAARAVSRHLANRQIYKTRQLKIAPRRWLNNDWLEFEHRKSYTAWTSRRNSQSFVHTWLAGTQTPKVLHSLNVTKKFSKLRPHMTGWNSNTKSLTQLERHEEILKGSSRHDWLELKHQKSYTAWTSRRNSQSFVHTWLAGTQTPKALHSLNFTKKFSLGNMSQKHAICCQVYRSTLILLLLLLILDKTRGAILWVPSIG